ncbi:MAG: cytochrome P460 family protein [Vicinamibacteria bacterium]
MRAWSVILLSTLAGVLGWQASVPPGNTLPIPYPEDYRDWTHVKSSLISPTHPNFAANGGYRHTYANETAMEGYRTRAFPEGSIIVFERLEMLDGDGVFIEGPRRGVDVMVKDSVAFASTGGWGFQRFVKDSKPEIADSPTPQQCFACHDNLKKDELVLSTYRP